MKKSEENQLVDTIINQIAQGRTKHMITEYLKKTLGLSAQKASNIYDKAMLKIHLEFSQDKERHRDLITFRLEDLYQKAYSGAKYGVCANILKELSELQGLKTTNVNLGTNVDNDIVLALTQQLNAICLIKDKGTIDVIDNLIQQSIQSPQANEGDDEGGLRDELDAANSEQKSDHSV